MDATQAISDSILESDEEENKEENQNKRGRPLAKLCILNNSHLPETELPLFLGDNVLGRDPSTCSQPLLASSVSKQHATICISVYRRRGCHTDVDVEALVWDLGSMNGTRKGRLKLTPNVRYALGEGDSLVLADIPCQYVSCSTHSVSSQGDMRTPGKTVLPDALGDTDTVSSKCVSGGTEAKKTSVRGGCLSFEQTPTQPKGSLVSESDSDDERGVRGDRRLKTQVSDSDSHKSSPSSSSFLSPPNKIVPESEDESPIRPSTSTRSNRHVSFNTENTNADEERQHLEKNTSLTFVDNSEEEEERATRTGTNSKESRLDVEKQKSHVSFPKEGELLVSTPGVSLDAIPAFNMDSDTDVEGEEGEEMPAGSLSLNTSRQVDHPPNTVLFHMDSDTDAEEDEDVSDLAPKTVSHEAAKPSHVASGVQFEGIISDSDTDVEEEDAAVSDAILTAKATSVQADSASSRDFHLDSDTDDEDEAGCRAKNNYSKSNETLIKSDLKTDVAGSVCAPAAGDPSVTAALTEPCASSAAAADLDILSDSDTDMEEQKDSPLVTPLGATNVSASSDEMSGCDSDTDLDEPHAGDEVNPADLRGNGDDVEDEEANLVEKGKDEVPQLEREHSLGSLVPLLQNCSTPVQDSEDVENMETQAFISPSAAFREDVENMETQAFISPSAAFRPAEASALRHVVPSSCSDSQEDEDYTVAETQSFVLQTRNQQTVVDPSSESELESKPEEWSSRVDSFQLGLSDSSHLLCQESTQAFVLVEERVNLEETQAYISTDTGNDSNLEATQPYEENEEPVKVPDVSAKEGCVNLAFEATQAYISEPYDDSEKDEDKRRSPAVTETADRTDNSSTLAVPETQPALPSEEEGSLETNNSVVSAHVKPKVQIEMKEKILSEADFTVKAPPVFTSDDKENNDEDLSPQLEEEQTQPYACSASSLHETQPVHVGAAETQPVVLDEDSDEYSMPLLRKRKAKQLHIEEEESQQLSHSDSETQPVAATDDDDDDSVPCSRKRKAKPLQLEDETQSLGDSDVSAVGSRPSPTREDKRSNKENFSPCPQKRNAKQVQEEQTPPLIGAQVSQPEVRGEEEENDSEVFVLPRKRKAKQLHLEDEESQQLTTSELSTAQTQLTHENEGDTAASPPAGETLQLDEEQTQPLASTEVCVETQNERDGKSEDSLPGPRRKAAKLDHPEEPETKSSTSEASAVETLLKTKTEETNQSRASSSRQTKSKLTKENEEAECSAPPKRQTRKESKALPKTRGRRGKARAEDDDSEVEVKQTRGRVITRQREDEEEKEADDGEQQEEVGRRRRRGGHQNKGQAKEDEEKLQMEDAERVKPHAESVDGDRMKSEGRKEKERSEVNVREKEKEQQTRLETEKKAKGKQLKEEEETLKVPARGRRSTRKTTAAELEQSSSVSTSGHVPARRTPSRSNSISSERSASSANTQQSKRGGRGGTRSSNTLQTPISRSSRRRVTVAAGPVEQNSSVSSETSSCRGRARGGRQQGRGRKTSEWRDASSEILRKNNTTESDSQLACTSRGQQRVNSDESKPSVLKEEDQSSLEKSPLPKRNVRGRGQKAVQTENVEKLLVPSVSDVDVGRNTRNRKKSELEADTNVAIYKVSRVPKPAAEEEKDEQNDTIPAILLVRRTGRASSSRIKKNVKESLPEEEEDGEKKKVEAAEKKSRGRASTVQKNKKEELTESGTSASSTKQTATVETSKQPQTPTGKASRKRQASSDSSPLAKTPRSSSGSPAASCRLRAGSQAYKVLFTGVTDEEGERVVTRLGGGMAKGVADMNCLVTDKVRRTVKFLCAVAKGIPVVTTDWLAKSGKTGSFLSPNAFIVKDPEQEKKFSFCLQDSLETARSQLLLQGYKIHVTKSVKPEPVHMKEIICCSGAVFLPKMPSSQKPQTVVISCEEDWRLCGPAVSASLPVVTAEFILTGVLQQKLDFQNHALTLATNSQPAGDRGRSKRKT